MLGGEPPRQVLRVEFERQHLVTVANIYKRAELTGIDQSFGMLEAGLSAAIVGDEQWQRAGGERLDELAALGVVSSERLLDVGWFAGRAHAQAIVEMRAGRRGDIDGVDVRIVDQTVGVVIPSRDAVPAGEVLSLVPSRRMTATTELPGIFWKAGPLFILVTSPQPMNPQRTWFMVGRLR